MFYYISRERESVCVCMCVRVCHHVSYVNRSSSASAAAAFAVATAGSSNPRDIQKTPPLGRFSVCGEGRRSSFRERPRQESIISTAATMRVLNVLRHWVSKHSQASDGQVVVAVVIDGQEQVK